jgi:hypothetical protein
MINAILGIILMAVVMFEMAFGNPFTRDRGWDAETTPYFFKSVIITIIAIFLICT